MLSLWMVMIFFLKMSFVKKFEVVNVEQYLAQQSSDYSAEGKPKVVLFVSQ